jgi:hypothetical protein
MRAATMVIFAQAIALPLLAMALRLPTITPEKTARRRGNRAGKRRKLGSAFYSATLPTLPAFTRRASDWSA